MTNKVVLPSGTTLGKSHEYGIDLNLGTYGAPAFQPVRRMSGWAPQFPKITQDQATYDDRGAPNEAVAGRGFNGTFTVQANRSLATGHYLPEVEALLAAARAKDEGATLDIRVYHKPDQGAPHPTDAYRAQVTVEATRVNTGNTGIEVWSISLAGQGEVEPIANPFTGWGATAPVVAAVTPPEAETGELVTIQGSGLLGASAVTFDAIPADDFVVVSGASIIASVPAGVEGPAPVVVTTPGGASQAFPYTRGA